MFIKQAISHCLEFSDALSKHEYTAFSNHYIGDQPNNRANYKSKELGEGE